jgi:hypothetical protein
MGVGIGGRPGVTIWSYRFKSNLKSETVEIIAATKRKQIEDAIYAELERELQRGILFLKEQ